MAVGCCDCSSPFRLEARRGGGGAEGTTGVREGGGEVSAGMVARERERERERQGDGERWSESASGAYQQQKHLK